MPIDYRSYNVDPFAGQRQGINLLIQATKNRNNRQQADIHNAIAEKRIDQADEAAKRDEQRIELAGQREDRIADDQENKNELKTIGIISNVVGKALDSVKDNQSHQAYRQTLSQLANSPLGQNRFFQSLVRNTPETYDPQKKEQGLRLLSGFRKQVEEKGFTLSPGQTRYDASGNKIVSSPEKTSTEKTASIKEYEYAKGQGYKGNFEEWQRASKSGTGEKENIIEIGDKKFTLSALGTAYSKNFNLPDDYSILLMETSKDPDMQKAASKIRERKANLPTFEEWVAGLKRDKKMPWDKAVAEDPFGIGLK